MRSVRGIYDGSVVVLQEEVDLAPGTEVVVVLPDPEGLLVLLDQLDEREPSEKLTLEEIVEIVHEVREDMRDAALIEERRGEPTRPLEDVLRSLDDSSESAGGCATASDSPTHPRTAE